MDKRNPILFSLLIALVALVIYVAASELVRVIAPGASPLAVGLAGGLVAALAVVLTLNRLDWWAEAGLRGPYHKSALLWFVPLLIFALLPLAAGYRASASESANAVFFAAASAIWRVAAQGIILHALRRTGDWTSAIIAGLLFGVMHLDGLLAGDAAAALANALPYALLGFAIAALKRRTGTIVPQALCYALLVFTLIVSGVGTASPSPGDILPSVLAAALLAVYGAVALALPAEDRRFQPGKPEQNYSTPVSSTT